MVCATPSALTLEIVFYPRVTLRGNAASLTLGYVVEPVPGSLIRTRQMRFLRPISVCMVYAAPVPNSIELRSVERMILHYSQLTKPYALTEWISMGASFSL